MTREYKKTVWDYFSNNVYERAVEAGFITSRDDFNGLKRFADKALLTSATVQNVINNDLGGCNFNTITSLAHALNCDVSHLFLPPKPETWEPDALNNDPAVYNNTMAVLETVFKSGPFTAPNGLNPTIDYLYRIGMIYDLVSKGETWYAMTDYGLKFYLDNR